MACRTLTKCLIAIYKMKCGFFASLHVRISSNWFSFLLARAQQMFYMQSSFFPRRRELLYARCLSPSPGSSLLQHTNITQSRAKYFNNFLCHSCSLLRSYSLFLLWDLSSYSFCSLQKISDLFPSKFTILTEFRLPAH